MTWNILDVVARRLEFVRAALTRKEPLQRLCLAFGISRPTGYLWLKRYAAEGAEGLVDRPRGGGKRAVGRRRQQWEATVLELRRAEPLWGPRKLRAHLQKQVPGARLPRLRTIARFLQEHGLVAPARRRSPKGPAIVGPARTVARRCHTVWTIDFKGHFRTGDGTYCRPLTVRDLFSRYLLLAEPIRRATAAAVRQVMLPCLREHGLPRVIRVDHGSPFAGVGALELSQLSVWWWRLGIQVEFTRPGKPQDNGAHEQMHRVLHAATACPPAASWTAQRRKLREFCRWYNERRPHEALRQRTPATLYHPSPRPYAKPKPLRYPAAWRSFVVGANGKIYWAGRQRRIGQAFAHECIGLKPRSRRGVVSEEVMDVYWGRQLIGELHASDATDLRAAFWKKPPAKE
jgi:putative transposase